MQVNCQVPALSFQQVPTLQHVTKEQSHSYPVNNSKANCGQIRQAYIGQWWCAYASGGPCLFDAMYEIAEKLPQKQFEGKMITMNAVTSCHDYPLIHQLLIVGLQYK
jgi:hypothetical protein